MLSLPELHFYIQLYNEESGGGKVNGTSKCKQFNSLIPNHTIVILYSGQPVPQFQSNVASFLFVKLYHFYLYILLIHEQIYKRREIYRARLSWSDDDAVKKPNTKWRWSRGTPS